MIEYVCVFRSIMMTLEDAQIWDRFCSDAWLKDEQWLLFNRSLAQDRKDYILMFARTDAGRDACRVL